MQKPFITQTALFITSPRGIWYRPSDVDLAQTLFRDLCFRKFCHLELAADWSKK